MDSKKIKTIGLILGIIALLGGVCSLLSLGITLGRWMERSEKLNAYDLKIEQLNKELKVSKDENARHSENERTWQKLFNERCQNILPSNQ